LGRYEGKHKIVDMPMIQIKKNQKSMCETKPSIDTETPVPRKSEMNVVKKKT
jgi:uncharacterized protein YbbK (DUF523 family)